MTTSNDDLDGLKSAFQEVSKSLDPKQISLARIRQKDILRKDILNYITSWVSINKIKNESDLAAVELWARQYGLDPRMNHFYWIPTKQGGTLYVGNEGLTHIYATNKEYQKYRFIPRLCTSDEIEALKSKDGEKPAYAFCCEAWVGNDIYARDYGTMFKSECTDKNPRGKAMTRARVRCMKQVIVATIGEDFEIYEDVMELTTEDYTVEAVESQKNNTQSSEGIKPPHQPSLTEAQIEDELVQIIKDNQQYIETKTGNRIISDDGYRIMLGEYFEYLGNPNYTINKLQAAQKNPQGFCQKFAEYIIERDLNHITA